AFSAGSTSQPVTLTEEDAEALVGNPRAPAIASASPVVSVSGTELVAGQSSYEPGEFVGTTPSYAAARDYQVESGRFITQADVKERLRVAVIGPEVATQLFPGQSPLGKTIQANGRNFEVVGITKAKGSSGTQSQDDGVIAPITAVQDALAGYGEINSIAVQATGREELPAAEAQITAILDQRHGVSEGITVINQSSIVEASSSSEGVFTTLLTWVAAISLLVGGIGVMNIMLVSVTERTREIGIRKAIGARRSDILAQFLTEAVLVSALGGLLGILAGVVGSRFPIVGVHPAVAPYSIALAAAASLGSGLFFGTYPAMRASRLRPMEALRFD
ncbi:MAG: putative transport system permease protein, partial [Solirubrobacterales bacterium]|nr:putative transport system permease protein [Solirubrobacterales bacterium]